MKTRHTSIILLLLALLFSVPLSAQKMTVESMKLDITDVTGSLAENLVPDNNGNYGGLVRVYLPAPNATFEGAVLRQQKHSASEYWVVVAKDYYRLKVVVPGFQPLDVNFRDYNITGIESQRTYVLTINVPQLLQAGPVDDGKRYFVLNVDPKNATVLVDKQSQQVTNGQMSILLTKGDHEYSISAPGYSTEEGVVTIAGEKVTKSVQLKSARSTLKVSCSTQGAKIYVNDELRGTSSWTGELNSGEYRVEARLEGYRSRQESVTLGAREEKSISFPSLSAITGMLNVNYLPAESEVYIDGKKVGTSPDIFRNIAVGSRTVEIRKEGYEPLRKTVEVKENEQASLTGSLTVVAASASQSSSASDGASSSSSGKEVFTVNGVSFTMIRVDGGTFTMGATEEQGSDAEDDEKPAHEVTLSTYMIGETEVTQALWQAVMGSNPSYFKYSSSQNPVEKVSWDDCQEFIKKLNSLTGKSFRLPTEAEWELAARGGNKSKHYKYSGSNTLEVVAWYYGNSGRKTHPVKTKSANELGLYDMSGNVWEWCEDWYGEDYYKSSPKSNPMGPSSGSNRVRRGGGWLYDARGSRVTIRGNYHPVSRDYDLGLRLAL